MSRNRSCNYNSLECIMHVANYAKLTRLNDEHSDLNLNLCMAIPPVLIAN